MDRPARHLSILAVITFPALLPSLGAAQDYTQYEVQYMTVRPEATEALNEALAEHNQEYHSGGAYHANVWYVVNGPRTGQLVWIMGPLTFAQLDGRPAAGGHDDDWSGQVVPHLEPVGDVSYWRRGENLSYRERTDVSLERADGPGEGGPRGQGSSVRREHLSTAIPHGRW